MSPAATRPPSLPTSRRGQIELVSAVQALLSQCTATFDFVGAAELVSLYRRIKAFSLELPVLDACRESPEAVWH